MLLLSLCTLFHRGAKFLNLKDIKTLFEKCKEELIKEATNNALDKDTPEAVFCDTCYKTLKEKKKLPTLSRANGLALDEIPEELKLTDLEEQFIAKCLIFMKVVKLPTSRIRALKYRIINVPMANEDISKTVTSFPRTEEKAGVIAVKLKRMMVMKNCHAEEFIVLKSPSRL